MAATVQATALDGTEKDTVGSSLVTSYTYMYRPAAMVLGVACILMRAQRWI